MATEITVGIAGAAGDGLDRTGDTLARTAARLGLHLFTYNSYQSLIRGGHTWLRLRLSEEKVDNHGDHLNVLVALNQDGIERHAHEVEPGGAVVFNSARLSCDRSLVREGVALVPLPVPELTASLGQDPPGHAEHRRPRRAPAPHRVRGGCRRRDPPRDLPEEGPGGHRPERGCAARGFRPRREDRPRPGLQVELQPQAAARGDGQPDDRAGGGRGRLQVLLGLPDEPRLLRPALAGLPQREVRGGGQAGRGRAGGGEPRYRGRSCRSALDVRDLRRRLRPHERSHRDGGDDRDAGGDRQRPARRAVHGHSHQDGAGRPQPGVRRLPGRLPAGHHRAPGRHRLLPHRPSKP